MRFNRRDQLAKVILAIALVLGMTALGACAQRGTWVDRYGNIHGEGNVD